MTFLIIKKRDINSILPRTINNIIKTLEDVNKFKKLTIMEFMKWKFKFISRIVHQYNGFGSNIAVSKMLELIFALLFFIINTLLISKTVLSKFISGTS